LGSAAVETFVKSPKQERRVNRLYDGSAGVPGYSGATKKTAACAGMTLWFAGAAFLGVVGVFVYHAVSRHMDTAMDVDSALEPCLRNATTVIGRAMGWRIAARCDRGHDYANGV
jgi:hypothetical protein